MAFCKFSSEFVISNQTSVDNLFINEFLPNAPAECVKVYLYGLYKCSNANAYDNTIESFAKVLNLTEQEIEDAFLYWQEEGLVQVLSTLPIEIRYMPLKNVISNTKKYKPEEFDTFNSQVQEIIEGRQITPTEYEEYYYLLKVLHFQPEALLMLVKFCTQLKGTNVGYRYIVTIAKNWARENILTSKAMEKKILVCEQAGSEIETILKICGAKRLASLEERELYIKWTKNLGFDFKTIEFVANNLKKSKVNFEKLDQKLLSYYEMKKLSIKEIQDFEQEKSKMFTLAKDINKKMGLYYENLEPIIESYISKWLSFGHNDASLLLLADFCFKNSIRTLEGLDSIILKLYKLGIVSVEAIKEYTNELISLDQQIKEILEKLGISRLVTNQDRTFFKIWKQTWDMSEELISYGVELSAGKFQPMQYLNKLLSSWHTTGIKTPAEAEKIPLKQDVKVSANKGRSYKKEDLDALFDSLEEIEI